MVFGAFSEISKEARKLLCYAADTTCSRTAFTVAGASRRRASTPGSRSTASSSSCGNSDFTNAPGHGDDDARFYDRQQAYVHARGG